MFDEAGSRSEFLRILADLGEEPAFVARARAPQTALDDLLRDCANKRHEMLEWPRLHLATLGDRVAWDWTRLSPLVTSPESVALLASLHAQMPSEKVIPAPFFSTDARLLEAFVDSAERFNRQWQRYVDELSLDAVNRPRRDYNRYYPVEKACAFGTESALAPFQPLEMIDRDYLRSRFELLALPTLRRRRKNRL